MSRKKLTVKFFMNGEPIERLTDEQLESMSRRLSREMSLYYTNHPEEYERLLASKNCENAVARGEGEREIV